MASPPRNVLLVEPWLGGSHQAWAEGLQRTSRHSIEVLGRPPGNWRTTFERSARELADTPGIAPDLVIASSMMDTAEFLARSGFEQVPTLLYLHENQLTYDRDRPDLIRGAANWRSVRAADRIAFNSRFHLDDFFGALPLLGVGEQDLVGARAKSLVLPVGIDPPPPRQTRDDGPPVVLWNHRWEHDKDPQAFVDALITVADLPFRLILAGEGSRLDQYVAQLGGGLRDRVLHAGFAPADRYPELVGQADIVVSTARQEFFGIAVAEAMAAGAVPLVPNRLAYPELLGSDLAACLYEPGTLAERLRSMLRGEWASFRAAAVAAGRRFGWDRVAPRYDELIDEMT